MTSLRRVGILGGMGPEATISLMQKVLATVTARDDADHIPLIVDQNPQVPSRIRHLIEGTGEDPAPVLAAMARRLEAAGAEALAMPCNTAHHYASAIRAASALPLIDMVALSAGHALTLAGPGATVAVLASPAVRRTGMFDRALEAVGLRACYSDDDAAMLANIQRIKANGAVAEAASSLSAASSAIAARGARIQIIACTEFSLVGSQLLESGNVFDALDRLVEGIVQFSMSSSGLAQRASSHSAETDDER